MYEFSYEGTQEFLVYCANTFISSFKGKDTLLLPNSDSYKYYLGNSPFPNTAILSEKQNNIYFLERIYNDVFITTEIIHPFELRGMSSEFWVKFFDLEKLGKVSFLSNSFNDEIKDKNNKKDAKSVIYSIIKEQVLLYEYQDNYLDLGKIEVCFNLNESSNDLVNDIVEALTILHRINYMLYRKNYLKTKNK